LTTEKGGKQTMVFLLKKKKKKTKNFKSAKILKILKRIQFFKFFCESHKNYLRLKALQARNSCMQGLITKLE
jgi:hypothetical protein